MINFIKNNFIRNLKKDNTFFKYNGATKKYEADTTGPCLKRTLKNAGGYVKFLTDIGINKDGAGKPIMTVANLNDPVQEKRKCGWRPGKVIQGYQCYSKPAETKNRSV
jgi:hypothetical protein